MSFAHVMFKVTPDKFDAVVATYSKLLPLVGAVEVINLPFMVGWGQAGSPFFLIKKETETSNLSGSVHFALKANTRKEVDEGHALAVSLGLKTNGAPGVRAEISPNYYAAFFIDEVGNNVEFLCTEAEHSSSPIFSHLRSLSPFKVR